MNTPASLSAAHIVNITEHNAQQYLIEESQQRLVVACFWAAQNPPSVQMLATMENIANRYQGRFLLATVDVAQQTMIARQLGVQSLPTVMLIQEGRPVDGFAGSQSDTEICAVLDKYLPKPWDEMVKQAQPLMQEGNFSSALALLRQAYNDSSAQPDIGLQLAHCYVALKRLEEAEALLNTIPMVNQDALYEQLRSQIHLQRTAAKTPEVETLEQAIANDPDNLTIKLQLAIQYQQEQHNREALTLLLSILKADKHFNNGEAKKIMLDIFKSLGNGDPLVTEFQRQLFALLY